MHSNTNTTDPTSPPDGAVAEPDAATLRARRIERMRNVHRELGEDERYLTLAADQKIWFVTMRLDREVHAQAMGFTSSIYEFAAGIDAEQAIEACTRWLKAQAPEVGVVKCDAVRALENDPCLYTFPEQIHRLDMPAIPARPAIHKEGARKKAHA